MQVALKTRLVGALVLVAVAVIVVPLFFPAADPAADGQQNIALAIPTDPGQDLQTRTLSLAPPASSVGVTPGVVVSHEGDLARVEIPSRRPADVMGSAQTPAPTTPDASAASSAPAVASAPTQTPTSAADTASKTPAAQSKPKPKSKPKSKPTPKPVPKTPPAAPSPAGKAAVVHYLVSLGAYADKRNAEDLVAKAGKMGYPVKLGAVQIDGRPAARVEVGPFASRAAAQAARLKLHAALPQAAAKVHAVARDQAKDAPASALPAGQAGGWAVQLVAYSKKADADGLRARLQQAGFDAYVDDVRASGQTLWRVRVGPRPKRDQAQALQQQVKAKFPKLAGVLVTVP